MNYLTLDMIKKQCVVDPDYTEDDDFLTMCGDAAESMAEQMLDLPLDEVVATYGEMPPVLMHAIRMLVDYFYACNRGSAGTEMEIPNAVFTMLKLLRNYK